MRIPGATDGKKAAGKAPGPLKRCAMLLSWVALLSVSSLVPDAKASVLTFDTGQANNADLSTTFGSSLSSDIAGANVNNGSTPDVTLGWAPSPNVLEIHGAATFAPVGDGKVLQLDLNGGEADPTVTFTVATGVALRVNSLVIGHATDMVESPNAWTITISEGGGGPQVFSHTTAFLGAGDTETVMIHFLGAMGTDYVLKFDDGGADHVRAGIDNLSFNQFEGVASLIVNGGNDEPLVAGEIPGWDEIVGTTWTNRSALPSPQAGSSYFFAGAGANHELAQTVDVSAYASDIDMGVQFFDFSGYVSGWSATGDTSQIIIEFEDASGVVLDAWDSGAIYNPYDVAPTWLQLAHSQFAPTYTRRVQVRLISSRNAGTNNDGYFDSIQLYTYVSHSIPMSTVAHRGGAVYAPENTLAAFELVSNQCDMVEIDVRVSSDGHLVVIHDATVNRTTDGTGNVNALTLAQLKALDAGSWFSSDFAEEEIPTFDDAIQTILPYATPVIERKAGTATSYVAAIQALGVTSDVMVISFDWTFLADVHALDPSIPLGALGSGVLTSDIVTNILATGADAVLWRKDDVSASEKNLVRSLGAEIFVWTANGADIQSYVDLGVDGIISDDPRLVRYLLDHQPSCNEAFAEELVSYWKFDDGLTDINTTNAADVEGRNPGTLEGFDSPPTWTTGDQARVDGALHLDGIDDFVEIPQSASLDIVTNALTISCWVKMETKPSGIPEPFGGVYASLEDAYELYQDKANSELRFKVTVTNGDAARPGVPEADLATGQWHHVIGLYNGNVGPVSGQASIYLDGKLKDVHTGNGGGGVGLTQWVKAGQHAAFGQNGMGNNNRFSGHVDEVAIWRRPLSHGELLQLFQSGTREVPLQKQVMSILITNIFVQSTNLYIDVQTQHAALTTNELALLRADQVLGPYSNVVNSSVQDLGNGRYRLSLSEESSRLLFLGAANP